MTQKIDTAVKRLMSYSRTAESSQMSYTGYRIAIQNVKTGLSDRDAGSISHAVLEVESTFGIREDFSPESFGKNLERIAKCFY